MTRTESDVEDAPSLDELCQIITEESRPANCPHVYFDYDERGVMSVDLESSDQRTRDVVHKFHDLEQGTRFLSLGEALAIMQMYKGTPLGSDKRHYRTSLVWQVNLVINHLMSSLHEE